MSDCTGTPGLHNDGCDCGKYINCPGCDKRLAKTSSGKYRKHTDGSGVPCDFAGTVIPEEPCNESASTATSPTASCAPSPEGDAPESATPATSSTLSSPLSPDAEDGASIPGATEYATVLNAMSETQKASLRARVEANLTPFSQPVQHDYERPTLFSQPVGPVTFEPPEGAVAQPPPPAFAQPAGRKSEEPAPPMGDFDREYAARIKELFYAYDNRRTQDNRSAQATMGPSEMGTPCDRRLALSLMRMPPVNPGGDGWASFVGTAIHAALERMFLWASADTGRFAVEQRLEFGSLVVPKGTADLLDRTLFLVVDHKCQGRWSRAKLKREGPSQTYRVQAHVYAHGARQRGEKVERVVIISWPRDESTLDDLHVWSEPYRPDIAKDAFERVEDINARVSESTVRVRDVYPDAEDVEVKARVAADFTVADDCRFCPFYLPNARDITKGCNGKR